MSMQVTITKVKKRDGRLVSFDKQKITNVIDKAFLENTTTTPPNLTNYVIEKLVRGGFSEQTPPSVEDIQDMVESTLIEQGHGEVAKAYILYRHERRKVRDEKMNILNTDKLDPVAKHFDINSLKVLASRYLFRNNKNEIKESPSQMFERVAILVGIGDLLYDNKVFDKNANSKQNIDDAKSYLEKLDSFDYKFKIEDYYLNKFHFRALINHYIELANKGQMKIEFKELLKKIAEKEFDDYAQKISEYYDVMVSQDFLPNSPTMMNAGGRLGQLSWQQWIGNAIAKTINMPYDVSADDVKAAYLLAHELGLKGITVYRDGSRHKQVLHMTSENAQKTFDVTPSQVVTEFVSKNLTNNYVKTQINKALVLKIPEETATNQVSIEETKEEDLCPTCKNKLVYSEGCRLCIECGYSGCTSG